MSDPTETPQDDAQASRGIGLSEPILLNPATVRSDSRIVARAIKERWKIPDDRRDGLVTRLFDIVEKTSVTVMTKDGPELIDDKADVNAIAAARVIVAMEGQNQEDEKPSAAPTVNVGVAVNGVTAAQVAAELVLSGDWAKI